MVLSDLEISKRCTGNRPMIDPFSPKQVREIIDISDNDSRIWIENPSENVAGFRKKVISYGCSSYGYDFRIADEFQIFHNACGTVVDPKNFDPKNMISVKTSSFVLIPPNSFVLGRSLERFIIPRDIVTIAIGKSTYARCGILLNVTPFEPEWEGYATIEIANLTPLPAKVYANEGLGQILFLEAGYSRDVVFRIDVDQTVTQAYLRKNICEVSYADKNGKYQNQAAQVVPPKI